MNFLHVLTVALVQGITEFLPISSQAHLILVPRMTGWCDQGLLIDIAVHVGTLGAVTCYFWRECLGMVRGVAGLACGRPSPESRLLVYLVLATLPVVAAGYLVKEYFDLNLRSIEVIGWATLGFGIVIWIADKWGLRLRKVEHLTATSAITIGCAQVLALIPGTSRSGITMAAARLLGFERTEAARFSLLMSIPVIMAAGTLAGLDLYQVKNVQLTGTVAVAAGLSFVAALLAIAFMMTWLKRATFTPFVIYRIFLGLALLGAVYGLGINDTAINAACPV